LPEDEVASLEATAIQCQIARLSLRMRLSEKMKPPIVRA
jgi:hypothetical protein